MNLYDVIKTNEIKTEYNGTYDISRINIKTIEIDNRKRTSTMHEKTI